jgi:23S rRNA pseudoU1915 N3-methylase RlmH
MTMRIILEEQIHRVFKINADETYHKKNFPLSRE